MRARERGSERSGVGKGRGEKSAPPLPYARTRACRREGREDAEERVRQSEKEKR